MVGSESDETATLQDKKHTKATKDDKQITGELAKEVLLRPRLKGLIFIWMASMAETKKEMVCSPSLGTENSLLISSSPLPEKQAKENAKEKAVEEEEDTEDDDWEEDSPSRAIQRPIKSSYNRILRPVVQQRF